MALNLGDITNCAALMAALSRTDTNVLPRSRGRTKDQTETYVASHLLATLAQNERLIYPLIVTHGDRPDIRLSMAAETIGIEITEAIPKQWASFVALAEHKKPGAVLEMPHFGWHAPDRTPKQLRALLEQKKPSSAGWQGDAPEQEWALFMHRTASVKQQKMVKEGFQAFSRNWLTIYDNLPFVGIELQTSLAYLQPLLTSVWVEQPRLHAIYIQSDEVVLEMCPDGTTVMPLHLL